MSAKTYDYLIVGQGLAGSLMGYRLEKAGKSVIYLDDSRQGSASEVAAGIINPITGRKFVKSWRIDELLPVAKDLYRELEAYLGASFWFGLPLVRALQHRGDTNEWLAKSGIPAYQPYLNDQPDLDQIELLTKGAFSYGGVKQSARVDIGALVKVYRERLLTEARYFDLPFNYQKLELGGDELKYRDLHFRELIFSEGWRGRFNPWFSHLPHRGLKGEVFLAEIEGPPLGCMHKNRLFLVPRQQGDYWIGATSDNDFADDLPTTAGKEWLIRELQALIKAPVRIKEHLAAVRPTVKDRRPLLGRHPEEKRLIIFNGLGTKGASLAPLMSQWLTEHLINGADLPAEVHIKRFS